MKKIAFITDIHFDEQFPIDYGVDSKKNWTSIIADLKSKNITNIIFGGDIGEETGHRLFFESLKDFSVDLILGNHDTFKTVSKFYNPYGNEDELYYLYDDENYRFIFLDTSSDKISDNQLNWLNQNLETQKSLIIFIHHPILKVPTPIDELYPLQNREKIKAILKNTNKPITLFSGHYHMNDERSEDNIKQIITQASSYQIEKKTEEIAIKTSSYGYRIITIKENFVKTELVNLTYEN